MSQEQHHPHITPLWVYLAVAGALFVLTGVTVAASYVDFNALTGFGSMNLVVAMLIASVKAGLVAAIFMHLVFDDKIYTLALVSGLAILAIFIIITLFDTQYRSPFDERGQGTIVPQVKYKQPTEH